MKNTILIVDDMEINREILAEMLEADYNILQADNGVKALKVIEGNKDKLRLILLDLVMPELDGFGVLTKLKELGLMGSIPVIVISGDSDVDIQVKSFEYGVSDFVSKPFDEEIVQKRVNNIVSLFEYQNSLEDKVAAQTKQLRSQYGILEKQAKKLKEQNIKIIDILGNVVESRNLESGEHIKRVKGFTRILANQLMEDYPSYGLNEHTVEMISEASALHDIGKIAIPDNVLLKPGKLTQEEYELMKSHTTRGCDILDGIQGIWEDEYRKTSYEICRHHHERYDGKGYPDKLKGEDIPISAQIVSVADVYDALVSERVYKSAYTKEEAFHMIINGECGLFSPRLLESLRNSKNKFESFADECVKAKN